MAIATYKDLCIDATEAERLAEFWAAVLGLEKETRTDGQVVLTGPTPQHTVWVNQVSEPKTVKHRMHLDVRATSVEEIVALGASVLDRDSFRWTLMTDPEGGEFCVFPSEDAVKGRLAEIVVDARETAEEAHRIATWWGRVLDAPVDRNVEHGYSWVSPVPGAAFEWLVFVPVPEPKTVKNRVHLDVTTPSVGDLVAAGATVLAETAAWTVMADPDGNEFCAFPEA